MCADFGGAGSWRGPGSTADDAKLRSSSVAGGFSNVQRATEAPFNMILEARGLNSLSDPIPVFLAPGLHSRTVGIAVRDTWKNENRTG
jgi:hypothetical protein